MSTLELVLNMLAEATTTEISKEQKLQTLEENKTVARSGGEVAGIARRETEKRSGKPVITSKKAVDFVQLLTDVIEYKVDKDEKAKDKKRNKPTLLCVTITSYFLKKAIMTNIA
jgi:hypothetical protein